MEPDLLLVQGLIQRKQWQARCLHTVGHTGYSDTDFIVITDGRFPVLVEPNHHQSLASGEANGSQGLILKEGVRGVELDLEQADQTGAVEVQDGQIDIALRAVVTVSAGTERMGLGAKRSCFKLQQ